MSKSNPRKGAVHWWLVCCVVALVVMVGTVIFCCFGTKRPIPLETAQGSGLGLEQSGGAAEVSLRDETSVWRLVIEERIEVKIDVVTHYLQSGQPVHDVRYKFEWVPVTPTEAMGEEAINHRVTKRFPSTSTDVSAFRPVWLVARWLCVFRDRDLVRLLPVDGIEDARWFVVANPGQPRAGDRRFRLVERTASKSLPAVGRQTQPGSGQSTGRGVESNGAADAGIRRAWCFLILSVVLAVAAVGLTWMARRLFFQQQKPAD